ncbi:MAG: hypothetical protein QOG97_289 [Acidimicrobiaceae bacterium]|nr:hypothetical protein [Acidimicrobiaceae bacterium]
MWVYYIIVVPWVSIKPSKESEAPSEHPTVGALPCEQRGEQGCELP